MLRDMSWRGINTHGRRFGPRFKWVVITVAAAIPILSGDTAWAYDPAGTDSFHSSAKVVIDLTMSGGPVLTVTVAGPVVIKRENPFDPGNGQIEINTEIVTMQLDGPTNFGTVTVTRNPSESSLGKIKQQVAGVDFPADSSFDVFFEIEGTPMGTLHNNSPMRLQAVIDDIPPLGASYTPPAVVGVALFNAMNEQVGVITHAAHVVGQRPSFSLAPGGTPGGPAVIFDVPTAPRIPAASLGLGSGDDVGGLSYGEDFVPRIGYGDLCFSVDPASDGMPGTAVRTEAAKAPREAHGDEFCVSGEPRGTNFQLLDETGDTASAFPLALVDDVDALTEPPTSAVDTDGNGVPDLPVYFSLRAGSPALGPARATPADILRSINGAAPTVFIPQAALGLGLSGDGDYVDAFCLVEGSKDVLFSLSPDSPTLVATGTSPADIFFVVAAGPPLTAPPGVGVRAEALGLLRTDNLDALKCVRSLPAPTVPTLSRAGLAALLVALMAAGGFFIARRRQAVGRPRRMADGV